MELSFCFIVSLLYFLEIPVEAGSNLYWFKINAEVECARPGCVMLKNHKLFVGGNMLVEKLLKTLHFAKKYSQFLVWFNCFLLFFINLHNHLNIVLALNVSYIIN